MVALIASSILLIFLYMSFAWLVSRLLKRNDFADIAWGIGFLVLTVFLFAKTNSTDSKSWLVLFLVAAWAIRLSLHIALRHLKTGEDGRYIKMKTSWKYKTIQSYTHVFLTQGFFLLLVSLPITIFFSTMPLSFSWYNYLGLAIWTIGFFFESVGDYQLSQFTKNPANKGQIMNLGLWNYTRHPNYFGEVSLWWGFYLLTFSAPFWYISLLGPLTITFLILGVSGVPMLEARYKGNLRYDLYKKSTSAFFPMPKFSIRKNQGD